MKQIFVMLCLAFFGQVFAATPSSGPTAHRNIERAAQLAVDAHISYWGGRAMLIAAVKNTDGTLVFSKGYGYTSNPGSVNGDIQATDNSSHAVSSISQPLTIATVVELVRRGILNLDAHAVCVNEAGRLRSDCVLKNFKTFKNIWPAMSEDIKIRHLVDDTSGLIQGCIGFGCDRDIAATMGLPLPLSRSQMLSYNLSVNVLSSKPGAVKTIENNQARILLAEVIEQVCGKSYKGCVDELVLIPRGIRSEDVFIGSASLGNAYDDSGKFVQYPTRGRRPSQLWIDPCWSVEFKSCSPFKSFSAYDLLSAKKFTVTEDLYPYENRDGAQGWHMTAKACAMFASKTKRQDIGLSDGEGWIYSGRRPGVNSVILRDADYSVCVISQKDGIEGTEFNVTKSSGIDLANVASAVRESFNAGDLIVTSTDLSKKGEPKTARSYEFSGFGPGQERYFLTSKPEEWAMVDAIPTFKLVETTIVYDTCDFNKVGTSCSTKKNVSRFFFPKAGSHFYGDEEGNLALGYLFPNHDGEGYHEDRDFSLESLVAGNCSASTQPLYRLYSERVLDPTGGSNHRYTVSLSVVDSMVAKGWKNEGAQGCVPQQ